MTISDSLKAVGEIARDSSIEQPHLVGGVPRDYAMGLKSILTSDVDLTTNTSDSLRLGVLVASYFNKSFNVFEDGHASVYFKNYNIDFSSNFKSNNVIGFLKSEKCNKFICPAYPDIGSEMFEVYSRDFTMNTLHQDIFTKKIIDITGRGLDDISDGVIKTPVPAEITMSDDPRRVFRAIYFASKYKFKIDDDIVNYVVKNNELLSSNKVKDRFVSSKINSSMKYDEKTTIDYLIKMNILSRVPMVGQFKDYLIKNKLIVKYLDGLDD
jgi:tRNA nucleotidyltransferase/poly(A) polymerase